MDQALATSCSWRDALSLARWRTVLAVAGVSAFVAGLAPSAPARAADLASLPVVARPLMQVTTTWAGQPLVYPTGQAEVTALEITLAPGAETGWHSHPVASFAYVLEGELEVTLEDGRTHRAQRGQTLAEVVGLTHNGRNVGTGPVRLIVFYAGEQGGALTQLREGPGTRAEPGKNPPSASATATPGLK